MKTIAFLAAALAAAPASAGGSAPDAGRGPAAGRAGIVSLSLHGGAAQPMGTAWVKERTKLGPSYGGAVHFGLSDHFEAAVSFDSLRMYKTRQVRIDTALANLVHYYDLGRLSPAVRLGVGPAVVHNARPDGVPNHNTFAARFGGGAEYKLCGRISTGLWADYFVAAKSVRKVPEVHALTFGLSVRWTGGEISPLTPKAAKAAAPPDDREPGAPKAFPKPSGSKPRSPATPAAVQEVPGDGE